MARDPGLLLEDILQAARDAVRYASDLTQNGFELLRVTDPDKYRALKNAATELGEAVGKLSPEITDKYAQVDWSGMVGLRNIITHQYFRVDMTRLWPVVDEEFPALISALEQELGLSAPGPEDNNPTSGR